MSAEMYSMKKITRDTPPSERVNDSNDDYDLKSRKIWEIIVMIFFYCSQKP